MNTSHIQREGAPPQPDRMFPILLIEALLLATGAVYYFWTYAV